MNRLEGKPIIISPQGETRSMNLYTYREHVLFLKKIFSRKPDQLDTILVELKKAVVELSIISRLFRILSRS